MSAGKSQGCFITGTDTGVGKTLVGTTLTRMLRAAGVDAQPRKPVETGCRREYGELVPNDGLAYFHAATRAVTLSIITPYRFEAAVSAERAARLAGTPLNLQLVATAARWGTKTTSFLLVEGAGGFYSPLYSDGTNADLARDLRLPVLLIAPDRLGCLNHILLTLKAIADCKLTPAAIILNRIESGHPPELNNAEDLLQLTSCPIFSIGHNPTPHELETSLQPVMKLLITNKK
jgi:dethiobiotin synthetase